jgi:hypothetical protein
MTTTLWLRISSIVSFLPLIVAFLVASLAGGVLTWICIFPVPVAFSAVLTACLAVALFLAR